MSAVGGDIIGLDVNHPTFGTISFQPKAGEDSTFDLGGFRSEDDANMLEATGGVIKKLNNNRWSAEITISNDANIRTDLEKLASMSGHPLDGTWTISHINGSVYRGLGSPVGDVNANFNAATIKVKISGGGTLKKIAG